MTDTHKPTRLTNKNSNKNLVEIFVRNYQKKAIRLWLEKKLNMAHFRQIIYERMKIKTEDQAIFLQGKLIQFEEDEIDLHNGFIFHLVNMSRVKISSISINVKRIQPNSALYKFTLQPEMLIGQFIQEVLTTKFEEIANYFMVYTGRELHSDKTFIEQYIQDGSQILLIHKVQNRKSQTVQNKKRNKPSKLKKQELQQVVKSKQATKNLNESFNPLQFSIKEKEIQEKQQKKLEIENENQKQNNEKYQLVNNSFKYQVHGSQHAKQQQHNNKSQELNAKELYQTAKFNKIQVLNQQGSQNDQQTEIIINNYNAFTYNTNPNNLNQKPISPIKNTTIQIPNQQILTRYGLVPQKQLTRIDRSSEQQDISHIVLGESIQLLNQKSSMELKSKNEEVEQSKNQQKQSEFYSDQYLKVSNASYQKINSFLLKTISSKYDDEGISLENSQRKRDEDNQLSYIQSHPYSGGIKSSLKYQIREHMMQNNQNVESHKSFKESTNQNLEAHDQNIRQSDQQNNKKVQELDQQHLNVTESKKNDSEPKKNDQRLDQSFLMGGEKKKEDKFVKKQNMIEVKDLTKTVGADFYMPPNLQTSGIVMSKQKIAYRSQLKGNAKQPQTASRNMDDLSSQIERNSEQERMLQNVAFVNNPMGHVGHVQIKNQILEGASKTYSIQEGDDEMIIKQMRVTKISQKNDILSQNSSAVSRYNVQSQNSDNPFKKMIQMANRHVKFQLSPQEKQQLVDQKSETKYLNIYNMSYVSSGYQTSSVTDSNEPINQFAYNPNPVYLPNLSNFGTGRESFISDAPQQMYNLSQKFSGTSVESQIITSTQYPMMNLPPSMRFIENKKYIFDAEDSGKEVQLEQFQKQLWEDKYQDKQLQIMQIGQDKMSLSMKKKEKLSEADIETNNNQENNTNKNQEKQENISQTLKQQLYRPISEIHPENVGKKEGKIKEKELAIQQDSLLLQNSSKNIQSSQHIFGQPKSNKDNELLNYLDTDTNPKPSEQNSVGQINQNYQQQLNHNNNQLPCERTVKKPQNPVYLSFSFSYEKQANNPERNIPLCFNVGDMIMTGIGQSGQIKSYAQRIRQQIYRQFFLDQESKQMVYVRNKHKAGQNMDGVSNKEVSNRNKIEEYLEQYTKIRQPLHQVLKSENLVEKQQSNLMQDQQQYEYENQEKQHNTQEYEQNLLNDYL